MLNDRTLAHRDLFPTLLVAIKSTTLPERLGELSTLADHGGARARNLGHTVTYLTIDKVDNLGCTCDTMHFIASD